MIGSLEGKVTQKGTGYVILKSGGVGYKVSLPGSLLLSTKVGQEVEFMVHTHVREDQFALYGFSNLEELEFFELLITVSGVGPKSGLAIMSLADVKMIKSAITSEDPSVFTKVSGIGRKIAERVIVELKGKLKEEADSAPVAKEHSDVLDALIALGYKEQEARDAMKDLPAGITLQEKIKIALKTLSK